ncbi:hypothetical protein FSP39_015717 [Pinctada imbricata]|uniref:Uncharacterized protein n=1 Tax=Pinctada imbricata TaxID=66713 RepID=A0AA88YAL9_PINIB|nr:hypothetical protein FSP39_015717 [Pinctada imbricata]
MTDSMISDSGGGPTKWNLLQFALLCCYTVGMHGSISLPYYVAAYSPYFLVAFYTLMIVVCIPVCYVQIKLGAVYRRGIVGTFSHLLPILKGVAVAILALTYIRCITNGLELSYSLYYAFISFAKPYPKDVIERGDTFLQRSDGIDEGGSMVWYIVLCLMATWLVIFLFTFRGLPVLGKISYVVSPVAIILTAVVFGYGYKVPLSESPIYPQFKGYRITETVRLEGNITSIMEDDEADVTRENMYSASVLLSPKPWIDAMTLHLYGIGLWSGILPLLGSQIYNRKAIINAAWSILLIVYGILPMIVVFAFIPYYDMDSHTGYLASSNSLKPGLSFMLVGIFGKARHVPGIALCIYLTIFLFGMLHQASTCIVVLPSLPTFIMRFLQRRELVMAVTCVFSFFLSLPYASQGGIYLYTIVNSFVDRLIFSVIILSTVPFLIGYIKQEYLYLPIERACMSVWYGLASVFPASLLIYYFAVYVYPFLVVGYDERWAETLGWVIAIAPISTCILLGAIHAVLTKKGSFKQKFIQALKTEHLDPVDVHPQYDFSDTTNTGTHASKSPSYNGGHIGAERVDTEVIIPPPKQDPIDQV